MEAATPVRSIEGEKAQRIVEAMRSCVARRGVAGATFDHVAREAGVSRGLLHYYFGTKEALLVEVVRRDCAVRMELLDVQLASAQDAEDVIRMLRVTLEELVAQQPEFFAVVFEMFALSRRNAEIEAEFADLLRRTRRQVAALLEDRAKAGVLSLAAEPEAVADVLFGLADGIAMRMLAEPSRDWGTTIDAGVAAVRALLRPPAA